MGGFLVNVFVRSNDQAEVAQAAKSVLCEQYTGRNAPAERPVLFVSPSMDGWVGVHDCAMQSQDEVLCISVARDLSACLGTVAITFLVHDGDFLCYWLARSGTLLDQYNSMPDYFRPRGNSNPAGGNATKLAEACAKQDKIFDLAKVLKGAVGDAFGQLEELSTLLGIPGAMVDYRLLLQPRRPHAPEVQGRDAYIAFTWGDLAS